MKLVTTLVSMEAFMEEKEEEKFEDNLYYKTERKIVGWGQSKKYPAIVSILVGIFVPIFGLFFVANQSSIREIERGRAGFLVGLASLFSLLWLAALVITLFVIF